MKRKTEKQSTTPPKMPKVTAAYSTLTSAEKMQEAMKSVCGAEPTTYNGKVIPASTDIIVD